MSPHGLLGLGMSGCTELHLWPADPTESRFLCVRAAALNLTQYSGIWGGKWCFSIYDPPEPPGAPRDLPCDPNTVPPEPASRVRVPPFTWHSCVWGCRPASSGSLSHASLTPG